jgi:protein gp37
MDDRGPNGEQGYTFNPWIGCTRVSPACDHCYAAGAKNKLGVKWDAPVAVGLRIRHGRRVARSSAAPSAKAADSAFSRRCATRWTRWRRTRCATASGV